MRTRWNRIALCLLVVGAVTCGGVLMSAQADVRFATSSARHQSDASSAFDTYCATCHNGSLRSPSGTLLVRFNKAETSADMWARAYRQLQASAMPPAGAPRPDRTTVQAMLRSIARA